MLNARTLRIAVLVSLITIVPSCNRDPEVRKQKYFKNAMAFLKSGDRARAVLELSNAVQVDPNFVEAANILAELQAESGNLSEAVRLLKQAEQAKPDYLPVRKGLANLYKLSGKLKQAQAEVDFILKKTSDDTDVLFLLGEMQVTEKKFTDAEGAFNRILELQPSHVQALFALASLAEKAGHLPEAERCLKLATDRNPQSPVVYLTLIKFYLTTGRINDAEAVFSNALQMTSNNIQILEAEEGFYEGAGKLAPAEEVARQIQSSHSNEARYWTRLADFYVRNNDWEKAKAELEHVLSQHKTDRGAVYKLIEAYLNLNQPGTAQKLNEDLLKKDPYDAYAHLFKGRLYLGSGNADRALLEFAEMRKQHPDYAAAYYWSAQAHLQRHEIQNALESLTKALKLDANYRAARLQLADLQNQAGAPDAAITHEQRVLKANPADTQAMLLYSQSLIQKQNYPAAAKVLAIVAARDSNTADLHRQLGILALIKKNVSSAQQEFRKAWELDPQSKPILEAILFGYLSEKQTTAAASFLQAVLQRRPQDPLLYHELAQVYLLSGRTGDAIAALQKALTLSPDNIDSRLLLAETYIETKQSESALQILATVMEKNARDSNGMFRAGILFEKLERWPDAQKAYERAVELDGSNAIAKNNLAWMLVSHSGNVDTALGLARAAKQQLPYNIQVTATLGWIYYQKQVYKSALEYLKQCVAKDPTNATFQYELGMIYSKLGAKAEARQSLSTALRLDPHFTDASIAKQTLASL